MRTISRSRTDVKEGISFNIQDGWRERLSELTGIHPDTPVWAHVNRHTFDFGLDRGWAQLDTEQDAPYYGGWTNPTERAILTYVEGDIEYRSFPTEEEYAAALREWVDWAKGCAVLQRHRRNVPAEAHRPPEASRLRRRAALGGGR